MKPLRIFIGVLIALSLLILGWAAGLKKCTETFYAHEANFYGRKLHELDKNGSDLSTGLGAFFSARYVYCANRGASEQIVSYARLLPESISEFQNDFGNDPCLYREELEKLRGK